MGTRFSDEQIAQIQAEGIEVLGSTPGKGAHLKLHCRYKFAHFNYTITTTGVHSAGARRTKNFVARLRRIKRAVDKRDPTLTDSLAVKSAIQERTSCDPTS